MRYLHLQRRSKAFISMGAYIKEKQPEIFALLLKYIIVKAKKDITERVLVAADVSGKDRFYRSIMEERPKGGKGGLLPGEKEELWGK